MSILPIRSLAASVTESANLYCERDILRLISLSAAPAKGVDPPIIVANRTPSDQTSICVPL